MRGIQFEYLICVTNAVLSGQENFNSPASTCICAAETHPADLKMNPVACSTRTDSGSWVTGFLIGSTTTLMALPTRTLLFRPFTLN